MSTPADPTMRVSQPGSVPPARETRYLSRADGRIGYDVAGDGSLVVLVPGMGDLRAGYRFLAPGLRAAGYRFACTDLRGHGDSDATFTSYGDEVTAGDVIALIEALGGPAVVVGNSMGAGSAVLAAAGRPGLICGLVLVGPFVRNGKITTMRRLLLRAVMAPPWAAISWKSYLPKLYAGQRPADFGEYCDQVIASMRQPGYAKAFSRTIRTSHDRAEARLADVAAPVLVVMASRTPTSPPRGRKLTGSPAPCAHRSSWCPRPAITRSRSGPALPPAQSCASWNWSRAVDRTRLIRASMSEETGQIAARMDAAAEPDVTAASNLTPAVDARPSGTVTGGPRRWLQLEAVVLLAGSLIAFSASGQPWWLVPLTILVPDLLAAGYLGGTRLGAHLYNLAHSTALPAALSGLGRWQGRPLVLALGLVWLAHIGADRLLGYGLKYDGNFQHTHLGQLGRPGGTP